VSSPRGTSDIIDRASSIGCYSAHRNDPAGTEGPA